ncbi:methionyl-tRNA formyltransferase [Thermodesulfobacteriota bacterium]
MHITYFGDGAWAARSFERLLQEGHQISAVVIRKRPTEVNLQKFVSEHQIPVLQPQNVNDGGFVEQVSALNSDINLSVSYDQILKQEIRQTAHLGFLNFHAGKLPLYRGRNVINWALINGEDEIGITAHFVDDGIDTGDIILQRTLPILWEDTYGDALSKVTEAFPDLVGDAVRLITDGKAERMPQAHLPGTYYAARGEGDEWINWEDSSRDIYNKIRGITHPGPGARTILGQEIVILWKAAYDPEWLKYGATPGQIVGRKSDGIVVKTGDSTILLQEIQISCNQPILPNLPIGTRFGMNVNSRIMEIEGRIDAIEKVLKNQTGNFSES